MYYNLIHFKGTEKLLGIRTKAPISLSDLSKQDIVSLTDDSTTEVTQFRPEDILRVNTVDEDKVKVPKAPTDHKKPKGMTIS